MFTVGLWGALEGIVSRALLAVVLVLTQLHFSESSYVRQTGEACSECARITDHTEPLVAVIGTHGDCHDCCEIRNCESGGSFDSLAPTPWIAFDVAIVPPPIEIPVPRGIPGANCQFTFLEEAPPTGPPSRNSSRGPPHVRSVQPFAGCKIMS